MYIVYRLLLRSILAVTLSVWSLGGFAQTTVLMKRENGVFIVPCKVNGLSLEFIFDTGADDVTISITEALFMLEKGYLHKEDIGEKEYYSVASGDIAEGTELLLREIDFAGLKLYNVKATIIQKAGAPLLLGQSVISMLGKIQLDPAANSLTIFNAEKSTYDYSGYAFLPGQKPGSVVTAEQRRLAAEAYRAYNAGVRAYNENDYTGAARYMQTVIDIHGNVGKKIFVGYPDMADFDNITAEARMMMGYSRYYSKDYFRAIPLLKVAKGDTQTRSANIYACLIDAYMRTNRHTEAAAAIKEGRKFYPDDVTLRNYELNATMRSGEGDRSLQQLEDESAKDPQNVDLLFNIGTIYLQRAHPAAGSKPANAGDLYDRSENAFMRALQIQPHSGLINYNLGTLYFNRAVDCNDAMNAITGTTVADERDYQNAKAARDGYFLKALPYFEEAYNQYSSVEPMLKDDERKFYKFTVFALKEVYSHTGNPKLAEKMKHKYESM